MSIVLHKVSTVDNKLELVFSQYTQCNIFSCQFTSIWIHTCFIDNRDLVASKNHMLFFKYVI